MSSQQQTTGTHTRSAPHENQLFTFDDIEKYTRVYLRGRPGWILDKGGHVSNAGTEDTRHILIQYEDDHNGERTAMVHENVVNRYLREGRKLWVDFENKLTSGSD